MKKQKAMKLQMADQFLKMGRLDQAKMIYKQVLDSEPDNAVACSALGIIYNTQHKLDLAIKYLKKAVELQPDDVNSHIKLGNSLRDHGHLEQAIEHYRHVLKLHPGHAEVLVILALISRNTEYNEDIRTLEELYRRPDLPRHIRRRVAFALGKVFDDLKEHDKAFEYLSEGNRLAREDHRSTIKAEARGYQRIKTTFNADFFRRYGDIGIADDSPILVTGMPRSGSSLVEQILASHPDVYGAGEVESFQHIVREMSRMLDTRFPDGFDRLDEKLLQNMATQYVEKLKSLANHEHFVTDKNMGSILHIGLIGIMLPNAKIIHCKRDPRDQGLSFFQHDFLHYQPNSYDLTEIGQYYQIRQVLMDHWDRMLPGRIYEIHYEELVADLETKTRQLLDHCILPFDRACLDFHETERTVNTASLAQVRQPLYASSVGRWKNYEKQLQPLISVLGVNPMECFRRLLNQSQVT